MRTLRWVLALLVSVGVARADDETKELAVRVVGPDGAAPAHVWVDVECPNYKQGRDAPGGIVSRSVPAKRCVVRARHAVDARGTRLPWAPTRLDAEAETTEAVVRMGPALAVEGRVVGVGGKPVAGVTVYAIEPWAPPLPIDFPGSPILASGLTSADGTFRLTPVGQEPFDVSTGATREFAPSKALRAQGGARDLTITVHRAAPIELRVVDADGKAVTRARITLWRHVRTKHSGGARGGDFVTNDEGRLQVPPLDPTLDLSLDVKPPDDREDLSPLKIDPWRPASGDVVVPPGFTAILHVKDETGNPLPGAVVQRLPSWEEMPGIGVSGVREAPSPNAAGRVIVPARPYGTSRFAARATSGPQVWPGASPWVGVTEKDREVDLVVPSRPRSMQIRVENPEPGQAGYLFAEHDGRDLPYQSFSVPKDGIVRQSNLAAGEYSVYVLAARSADDGGRAGVRARFRWDGTTEVVVPTAPPLAVRVRPIAPDGGEVSTAMLYVNGNKFQMMQREPDGLWALPHLPPGRYGIVLWGRRGEVGLRGEGYAISGEVTEITLADN